MTTHYHVTAHIPGCLNDTDLFPFDTITDAREIADKLACIYYGEETHATQIDQDTWIASPSKDSYLRHGTGYFINVEECTEPECLTDDAQD